MWIGTAAYQRLEDQRAALEKSLVLAGDTADVARDLAETRAALERVHDGTYGRCEACGGAIGRQRLLALPAARYCIGCAASPSA
jgi:DnaK suppressor protein